MGCQHVIVYVVVVAVQQQTLPLNKIRGLRVFAGLASFVLFPYQEENTRLGFIESLGSL